MQVSSGETEKALLVLQVEQEIEVLLQAQRNAPGQPLTEVRLNEYAQCIVLLLFFSPTLSWPCLLSL